MNAGKKTILILPIFISSLIFQSCNKNPRSQAADDNVSAIVDQDRPNFVVAAERVTPAVVHIKTLYENRQSARRFFDDPNEGMRMRTIGSGSGVVISSDGYIATNYHVIAKADVVEVVFPNRQSFRAKVVGRDPNTDLALLKVDADEVAFVTMGNSDDARVGEWVLAVGYPYSLNTTVTAGIISAKGRSLGIINQPSPYNTNDGGQLSAAIESFIQTDAAINPGNSGGALVNLNGELIGINTAIASITGSYTGYAFAVPVNLAKKILDDLKQFGSVQRGLLGISYPAPSDEEHILKQQDIDPGTVQGVFITGIQEGSAAQAAGLMEGDIIQKIDNISLYSSAEFSERIARRRPGDNVELEFLRNGKLNKTVATLKNEEPAKDLNRASLEAIHEKLGARFENISDDLKDRYSLYGGVLVSEVKPGGFFDQLGIPAGTIIAFVNGVAMNDQRDIDEALIKAQNSMLQILGIAPDGSRIAFNFSLGA